MQVPLDLSPLSYKGQWQKNLFNPKYIHKNEPIRNLSYEFVKGFLDLIKEDKTRQKAWKKMIAVQYRAWKIDERPTMKSFFQIMMKRDCKIQYLVNVAHQLHDISFEMCFYGHGSSSYLKCISRAEYVNREWARIQANQDTSKGYLIDVSYETWIDLAALIEEEPDWRRLGDGLGFTLFDCACFSHPIDLLEAWNSKFSAGTLMRIYFEAEQLKFYEVCQFIDGISLHKISAIQVRNPHDSCPELRLTTIFDMEELDRIYGFIDWAAISHLVFQSFDSKKEDIWMSGTVTLLKLQVAFKLRHQKSLKGFEHFQPKNRLGVTYSQVAFLADAIHSDSALSLEDFAELMSQDMGIQMEPLSIPNALCIYWQFNRNLDLTQFFNKTFDLLFPACPSAARILSYAFDLLNPKRYYLGSF